MTALVEVLPFFKDFTPGAWGIWLGIAMFAAWWVREYRETRKMSAEDRLARRDGYAKQVEGLQTENRQLRTELAEVDRRHRDDANDSERRFREYREWCERQHDEDRALVRGLQDEVTGLKRAMVAGQVAMMESFPPQISGPLVADAARRTGEHLRKTYKDDGDGEQ